MEIKHEKSECFSVVDCAFCYGRRNLEDMFEKNESPSKYSTMILKCFNIEVKKVSEDLKICEICIEQLSEALEFKQKLDCFVISKQSTEKVYEDNYSNDYSNLKLAFVVKNECEIDDCNDLESIVPEFESKTYFGSDKNPTSNISIDFESDKDTKSNILIDFESDKDTKSNILIDFKSDKNTESSASIDFQSDKSDEKPNEKSYEIHHLVKSRSENSNSFIPSIEPSTLICPVCKEEFNSHTLLLQHYQNHNPNYVCDLCGKVHFDKTSLIKHLLKHTSKRHPCEHCKNSYASKKSLYQHERLQHKGIGKYACRLCPKRFSSYLERYKHQTEDHGITAGTYVCPNCGKSYYTSGALSVHIRRNHLKIHNFECTVCSKKFFRKSYLDSHFIKHTSEKNFGCTVCNKKFSEKSNLDSHFVKHTSEKNFECTVCNKKYSRKWDLDCHFAKHTGEKNFECTVCNKKFYRKSYLDSHFVKHTSEKNFVCTVCNKSFFKKSELDSHFVKHTDEKKFECTVCNKKFSRKRNLDGHFVKHTGEKNFECEVCGKSYARKNTLKTHMKIHTNTRMYKCEYCEKTFIQNCALKEHFKTHEQSNN